MKKLDGKRAFMALVILLIVVIIMSSLAIAYSLLTDVKEFDMMLEVTDYMGFVADPGPLNFGGVPSSGTGIRELIIENKDGFSKLVHLGASGELKAWTSFSVNNFIVDGYETRNVEVRVAVPENAEYGNYTGTVRVYLTRLG